MVVARMLYWYSLLHLYYLEQTVIHIELTLPCRGFIAHFFQCSACANHFVEMTEHPEAESIKSRRDAVLWMWKAHNQVMHLCVPLHVPSYVHHQVQVTNHWSPLQSGVYNPG